MKFAIMGAGGIGAYFGARLAADGNDVVFIARGAHRAAMAERGLVIRSVAGDLHVERPQLHESPEQTGLCDVILFCVKLWDTEAAAEQLKPLLAHDTAVVSLQNGVSAEETLAGILGPRHVMGGLARISAAIEAPGVIRHTGTLAKIAFAELDGSASWRQDCLLAACNSAGFEGEISKDIRREIWEKFVLLAPMAGVACYYRCDLGGMLAVPERREMLEQLAREAFAVGRAKGVALDEDMEGVIFQHLERFPPEMKPSMLYDLEAGRRLELDWLNGEIVRLGESLGIETPANAQVCAALAPFALGARS